MKLKDYLKLHRHSYETFGQEAGVVKSVIQKLISGKNINLVSAAKIEIATKGKVKCLDLYKDYILPKKKSTES